MSDCRLKHDPIIYHEAGHALVGHTVGMRLVFADMTCLTVESPVVGLDCEPVPVPDRPRARALAALAGPLAEALMNGGRYNWRQDGKVAEVAAKALVQDNIEKRYALMIEWGDEARTILRAHERAMDRIAIAFKQRGFIGERALNKLVVDAIKLTA